MLKYVVTGADRETGEEVEIAIEARTQEEASLNANRRGILIAACKPADDDRTIAGEKSSEPKERPSQGPAKKLRKALIMVAVIAIPVMVALVLYNSYVWRPQHEYTQRTLRDAAAQSAKSAGMAALKRQQEQLQEKIRQLEEQQRQEVARAAEEHAKVQARREEQERREQLERQRQQAQTPAPEPAVANDPAASFEKFAHALLAELPKTDSPQFYNRFARRNQRNKYVPIDNTASFDVKRTDSLVTPYVGLLQVGLITYANGQRVADGSMYRVTLVWQGGRWSYQSVDEYSPILQEWRTSTEAWSAGLWTAAVASANAAQVAK